MRLFGTHTWYLPDLPQLTQHFTSALLSPHFRDEETEAQRDTVACPWYLLVSFHKYLWSISSRPQTGHGGLRDKEEEMAPTLREPLILKGRNKSAPLRVLCGGSWGHPSHSHLKLTCSFHYTHTHTHTHTLCTSSMVSNPQH